MDPLPPAAQFRTVPPLRGYPVDLAIRRVVRAQRTTRRSRLRVTRRFRRTHPDV